MRQQNYVYLVKDINVLGLSILSILMCFTFHMKIQKEGGKPKQRTAKSNKFCKKKSTMDFVLVYLIQP